jgi:acetyltransferase
VDIIGDAPPNRYEWSLDAVLQAPDDEVAGALVVLTPQAQTDPPGAARVLTQMRAKYPNKLLLASFIGGDTMVEPRKLLLEGGVPCFAFPESAITAIRGMMTYKRLRERSVEPAPLPVLEVNHDRVQEIFAGVRADGRVALLNYETSEIFDLYGIKNPRSRLARNAQEAMQYAEEIGFPLVAKIVSPQIMHKTDVGGVVLNIKTAEQAKHAFIQIMTSARKFGPANAALYGVEIQQMIQRSEMKKTSELIVGMSRDPQWGPLLMVGAGGIYANYIKDVAFELAHEFTPESALALLEQTRIYAILKGVRGEPRSDLDCVVDVMYRLSRLVRDFPDIMELDMNPLLVFEEGSGISAVDIKITISETNQ